MLLLIQAVGFASAPWNSLAAVRADRVARPGRHRFRRRRRDLLRFWSRAVPAQVVALETQPLGIAAPPLGIAAPAMSE